MSASGADDENGLLRVRELAQRSGVSAGTIKHHLREGLLGGDEDGLVRTSRNMAYYPARVRRSASPCCTRSCRSPSCAAGARRG